MDRTNNANAVASGQGKIEPEAAVHWVFCKHCNVYPVRGELFCCVVCTPDYNLCKSCNDTRRADWETHPHRFDFFYTPRAKNPPSNQIGGTTAQAMGNVVLNQAPAVQQVQYEPPRPPPQPTAQYQNIQVLTQMTSSGQPIILVVQQDPAASAQQQATEPYTAPPPLNHDWVPRYGSSDGYYHNTASCNGGRSFWSH
jgi:hypothetical protein